MTGGNSYLLGFSSTTAVQHKEVKKKINTKVDISVEVYFFLYLRLSTVDGPGACTPYIYK